MPDTPHDTRADDAGSSAVDLLVRAPKQARSRRTLRRILDASLEILEQEGSDALTVTTITQRANTSVGSFYARFEGKDDLLRYMGESALEDAVSEWARVKKDELPDGRKRRRMIRFLVSRLGRLYMRGPARAIVLLDGLEDPSPTRRQRLEELIALDVRDLLDAPDLRKALVAQVLAGVLRDATLSHLEAEADGGRETPYPKPSVLLPELVELLVGYLGGKVRAPTTDTDVAEVAYAPYRPAPAAEMEEAPAEESAAPPAEPQRSASEEGPTPSAAESPEETPTTDEEPEEEEPSAEPEAPPEEPAPEEPAVPPSRPDLPEEHEAPGGIAEAEELPDPWALEPAEPQERADEQAPIGPDESAPSEKPSAPESEPESERKPEPEPDQEPAAEQGVEPKPQDEPEPVSDPEDETSPQRAEPDPFDVWG